MSRVTVGEPLAGSRNMARFFGQGQALSLHRKVQTAMKTKEELTALKEEVETLNKKLHELTDEELAEVVGGIRPLYTRCYFSVADMEEYPGQIKVRVIRESND